MPSGVKKHGYNAAHSSFNDNETILTRANVSQLTLLWSRTIGPAVSSAPILGFTNIFLGRRWERDGAKGAESGDKLWGHLSCSGEQTAQPALDQGVLLAGDASGDLAGYEPGTGAQLWCDDESGSILSAPAVKDDTVYITNGGDAVALDEFTGQQRWRFTSTVPLSKTPAVANGVVYVTGGDTIFALEQATGKKLWRHNLAAFGAVSAPAVSNEIVYVGDGALYALSAVDGHVIWKNIEVSADGNMPTVAKGKVFVNSEDPNFGLWAFDASDGSFLWMTQKPGESLATVTVANGVVYDIAETGKLMMFNTDTGPSSVPWPIRGSPFSTVIDSQPVVANGTVYVSRNFFSGNRC